MTMEMHRVWPSEPVQQFISSLKVFDKKLDKLHEDVRFHGTTLAKLRLTMDNLAMGLKRKMDPDGRGKGKGRSARASAPTERSRHKHDEKLLENQKHGFKPDLTFKMKKASFEKKRSTRFSKVATKVGGKVQEKQRPRKAALKISRKRIKLTK